MTTKTKDDAQATTTEAPALRVYDVREGTEPLVTSGAKNDVGDPFPIVYGNENYVPTNPPLNLPQAAPKDEKAAAKK